MSIETQINQQPSQATQGEKRTRVTTIKTTLELLAQKREALAKMEEQARALQERWDSLLSEGHVSLAESLIKQAKTDQHLAQTIKKTLQDMAKQARSKEKTEVFNHMLALFPSNSDIR